MSGGIVDSGHQDRMQTSDQFLESRKPSVLGYVWAFPCTALGLLLMIPFMLFGARFRFVAGILEGSLRGERKLQWLPFNAITFGHVVLGKSEMVLRELRAHEQAHVRQYELWGPFFLLAYPLASLVALCRGRNPYWFNWFEVQARRRCSSLDSDD